MAGIGDLVTHLVANTAGFQQGFAKGQSIAKTGVAGITSAIAPLTGALAAAFGAGSAIGAAKEDLRAMQKLEAVLKATGGAAGFSATEIGEYASELQKATNFGDEVTVGAASIIATFKNIRGDNFKQAIALAQDMATVMDIDLDTAAKKLGKSLKDVAPEDVGAKLAEMQSKFGGAAAAVADPWTQLKNVIGDIGEQVGGILLPWVDMLSTGLMDVGSMGVETFASLKQTSQEWADAVMVAYSTLGDTAFLWAMQAELAVVQVAGAFSHFFTAQLPAWFQWFGENWNDIFFTAGDYALTIVANLGENIRSLWQGVLDFIAGKPVNFDWKPLTEGAVNTIKAMPDIPARVASEFEKGLQDDIAAQEKFIEDRQKELADGIVAKREDEDKKKGFIPGEQEDEPHKSKRKGSATLAFAGMGSSAAFSTIARTLNGGSNPLLKVNEQQLAEQKKLNKNVEKLTAKTGDGSTLNDLEEA
jgi:hypothetical protein